MITREQLITHILQMKNGTDKWKSQPDYARAALAHYNTLLPDMKLNDGVRDALKGVK